MSGNLKHIISLIESSASILLTSSHWVIGNLEQLPVTSTFNNLPDELVELDELAVDSITSSGIALAIQAQKYPLFDSLLSLHTSS